MDRLEIKQALSKLNVYERIESVCTAKMAKLKPTSAEYKVYAKHKSKAGHKIAELMDKVYNRPQEASK